MDIDSLFEKTQEKKALKQQEEANRAYTLELYVQTFEKDIEDLDCKLKTIGERLERMTKEIENVKFPDAARALAGLQKTYDDLVEVKNYLQSRLAGYENMLSKARENLN